MRIGTVFSKTKIEKHNLAKEFVTFIFFVELALFIHLLFANILEFLGI